jgi:pimeloyl-ACP methyl ester carboxylesterase
MATLASATKNVPNQPAVGSTRTHSLLYRVGRFILIIVALLVSLIIALPILLLFVATSVSWVISSALAVLYCAVVFALFRFAHTLPMIALAIAMMISLSVLAVVASQLLASTPPIADAQGQPMPDSIASLERITLGGTEQWITIRGQDINKPVLLFLAGGPGGSELVMTRRYLAELEEHFVVVNWDQPGTGKSYNAVAFDELTPQRYGEDAYALTLYLRERFDEEKIYVFGESWGSILGILLVQQYPELFHALVTTGQMVDVVENDTLMYEFAIEQATAQGRTGTFETLQRNGPPPYNSGVLIGRFGTMNGVVNDYMASHAQGEGTGHNLMLDSLAAQEYGLLDKVYWLLGLARTFTTVYPQLYDLDFRTQATELEIPVYFIKGRWDINASNVLLEEYFALLDAPHKELIWFEDSAHTPSWDEPDHFVDVMVNTVLAQTLSPASGE